MLSEEKLQADVVLSIDGHTADCISDALMTQAKLKAKEMAEYQTPDMVRFAKRDFDEAWRVLLMFLGACEKTWPTPEDDDDVPF